ncbi:MAG TPA: SDR family oxidoreductase [Smithella sp.]|nr:SDR family oxidoreductase [Smithella sp.]
MSKTSNPSNPSKAAIPSVLANPPILQTSKPSSFLVTGGAGFIGSNIVEELVKRGHTVRVLDNFSTGKRDNIHPFLKDIELIEGDIRDEATCRLAVKNMDYILHQAAMPSVPRSLKEPVTTTEVNVMGTVKLLTAAAKEGVRRFVYAASSSAYGDQPVPVKREDLQPRPLSPYAAAKLAGEYFCHAYSQSMGLETVGLRYFNVFGPRQDPTSQYSAVIPLFITALMEGRRPTIYGDGTQTRDFTYVANNVQANILAATTTNNVAGKIINIACGKSYSVLDLLKAINDAINSSKPPTLESSNPSVVIEPIFAPARKGDVKHSLADITLARELLNYKVEVDFTEGIKRTVEWYLRTRV